MLSDSPNNNIILNPFVCPICNIVPEIVEIHEELGKIMKSVDPENTSKISFEMWFKFLRMGKRAADAAKKQFKEKNNP